MALELEGDERGLSVKKVAVFTALIVAVIFDFLKCDECLQMSQWLPRKFDSRLWKNANGMNVERFTMLTSLLTEQNLIGRKKEEIEALLGKQNGFGKYTFHAPMPDNDWVLPDNIYYARYFDLSFVYEKGRVKGIEYAVTDSISL